MGQTMVTVFPMKLEILTASHVITVTDNIIMCTNKTSCLIYCCEMNFEHDLERLKHGPEAPGYYYSHRRFDTNGLNIVHPGLLLSF